MNIAVAQDASNRRTEQFKVYFRITKRKHRAVNRLPDASFELIIVNFFWLYVNIRMIYSTASKGLNFNNTVQAKRSAVTK